MIEYPAMIYKNARNNVYIANCIIKNLIGFGKTELAAIENLETSLKNMSKDKNIRVKPLYGFSIAR